MWPCRSSQGSDSEILTPFRKVCNAPPRETIVSHVPSAVLTSLILVCAFLVGLLLCAHAALAVNCANRFTVTHDEYWHIPIGLLNLKTGRFGPYVTDGTTNATVPRGTDPTELTLPEAVALLRARAELGPSRGRARKATKKTAKKPAKKTAKKAAKKTAKKATKQATKTATKKSAATTAEAPSDADE